MQMTQQDAQLAHSSEDARNAQQGLRTIDELMELLRRLAAEQDRLNRIEAEFKDTRDTQLLKEFAPDTPSVPVTLAHKIDEPHYLVDIVSGLNDPDPLRRKAAQQVMKEIKDDALIFNPNARVEIVECIGADNKPRKTLAVIGVQHDDFENFRGLREKERDVNHQIKVADISLQRMTKQQSQEISSEEAYSHVASRAPRTKEPVMSR